MDLPIPRLPHHRQERFGSVLVAFVVTQNLVAIVFCQFKRVKGRASHSLPLTRLNWRRFHPV
jgi:hypothetical protein